MKNKKTSNKSPAQLKGKLMAALAMLLVASVLMGSTTYAWLVLSIAPEVTGITTNIGANGSLEIALLNTETRQNMSTIRSGKVGESLAARNLGANITWGNLVDLNDASYGLDNIVLMPARLDLVANASVDGEEGSEGTDTEKTYTVSSGLLSIPTYGYDGRVVDVTADAVSTVYKDGKFGYVPASQTYGVRAIGTSDNLTEQASALAMAKSNVATYTTSASNAASGSLATNGNALVNDIIAAHALNADATFNDNDLAIIKAMIKDLKDATFYIDLTLRQGLVARLASVEGDEEKFVTYRNKIIDSSNTLSDLINTMETAKVTVPAEFKTWVSNLAEINNELNFATVACDALTGGTYTWIELRSALDVLINLNEVWINDTRYPDFNKDQANSLLGGDNKITFGPGSGVFADVADFTGDISTMVSTMLGNVEITTLTTQDPVYLTALLNSIKNLEAAGDATGTKAVTLTNTYGYALDLAFRCSAAESDLLLQTAGTQRIYEDSSSLATQGGGSFMEFAVTESVTNTIQLMDAVRVAFIDDAGNLLGVAKLNTSNRETSGSVIKAPLYLYNFSISEEDGSMIMGERKKTDNSLISLQGKVAKAVTVVVWLDGDLVDNSMVSGEAETAMSGMLNLQFASSADLVPARNTDLLNITTNPADLVTKLEDEKATYEAGQLYYSSVTWNAFTAAYNNALAVSQNSSANDSQIWNAISELTQAKNALSAPSHASLESMIDEMRKLMGKTDDLVSISIKDQDGNPQVVYEFTMEVFDGRIKEADVFHVDYNKNMRDEGNGLSSLIYTEESWNVLAGALYAAERMSANELATEEQIDAVMTALDTAYDALVPGAYFFPYDFAGTLYYYAVPQNEGDDTYGKWYDANFKRVISDLTILELDARAEPATVAKVDVDKYMRWDEKTFIPSVEILSDMYPTMMDDEIIGLTLKRDESIFFAEVMNSTHTDALNALIKTVEDEKLTVDVSAAEALLKRATYTTATEAQNLIDSLTVKVTEALEAKKAEEEKEKEETGENGEDGTTTVSEDSEPTEGEQTPVVVVPMSEDQRTVMTKAVSVAQAILEKLAPSVGEDNVTTPDATTPPEGTTPDTTTPDTTNAPESSDPEGTTPDATTPPEGTTPAEPTPEDPKVTALRTAKEAVEALLTAERVVSTEEADEALTALNVQLVANGEKEVTIYNTIVHYIPVINDSYEIAYTTEYPLFLSGKTGTSSLSFVGVTKNGVVFTASADVKIFTPADGAMINQKPAEGKPGLEVVEAQTMDLSASLFWNADRTDDEIRLGNVTVHTEEVEEKIEVDGEEKTVVKTFMVLDEVKVPATAAVYTWASSDMNIATVTSDGGSSCTVQAVKPGTVTISLSIETADGSTYTDSVTITVTAKTVEPEVTDPSEPENP